MPVPDDARLPLTAAQLGIWFAQARDPRSPVYNTGEYVELTGDVDAERLEAALRETVARTDALRLRFHTDAGGNVTQSIAEHVPFTLHRIDVSGADDPEAAADAWMRDVIGRPLDVTGGSPLFTQALITLAPGRHRWFQHAHHLLLDGYAFRLVAERVARAYRGDTPDTDTGIRELIEAEAAWRASDAYAADRAHWLAAPRTAPVTLDRAAVAASLRRTGRLVVVQEDNRTSSYG
ncbi:condensation domain-containing protein, partial [Streptomyces sp. NPDC006283]|uniref:condensation domain-containing protein n=1 Tax=Streptomyces sp. NPDC006283 TaxID=3156741 RepID=UPI0033AEA2E0